MRSLFQIFETYLMVLVHPFRIHQQFRYNLPIPNHDGHLYEPLTLAQALGISWSFALLRGLVRIIILNYFLYSFLTMQSEEFPFLQELIQSSSLPSYYFFLFSGALDVIFFPISTIVITEMWAWIIRKFSEWLNPDSPHEQIADQITTHALCSNLFNMIPLAGNIIQIFLYYFLLYAGLRSNLGAPKSLAWVILLTPMILIFMFISLVFLVFFYLFS
jgi:hypothetical protein